MNREKQGEQKNEGKPNVNLVWFVKGSLLRPDGVMTHRQPGSFPAIYPYLLSSSYSYSYSYFISLLIRTPYCTEYILYMMFRT